MASEVGCDRVLVVDDNADMVTSMRDVLESFGVLTVGATTIEEARQVLASGFHPNAALIDLRLGRGGSGADFARDLRADPKHSDVHIVAMSGHPVELQDLDDADRKLMKPFDIDDLLEALRDLCGS